MSFISKIILFQNFKGYLKIHHSCFLKNLCTLSCSPDDDTIKFRAAAVACLDPVTIKGTSDRVRHSLNVIAIPTVRLCKRVRLGSEMNTTLSTFITRVKIKYYMKKNDMHYTCRETNRLHQDTPRIQYLWKN